MHRERGAARCRAKAGGFTLIELMIVVAIVAILTAIAYPSYADSVRKSKRGHAKAALVELAQRAERWRTVQGSFAGFWNQVDEADQVSPKTGEGAPAYNIEFDVNDDATTFTLSAIPQDGQTADTRCMTLTLNQAGQKGESGTGTVADCW